MNEVTILLLRLPPTMALAEAESVRTQAEHQARLVSEAHPQDLEAKLR
jgi:hypothetical protein